MLRHGTSAVTLAPSQIPDDLGEPRIEHRLLGLDKRLIVPTLGVLALVIFWSSFVPWLDESIEGDPLEPGTVISLAGGVEFTPADGWNSDGAVFPGTNNLTVYKGGVTFTVTPGAWNGTPDELLDELIDEADPFVKGDRLPATLPSGLDVVGIDTLGEDEEGILVAMVSDELWDGSDERVTAISIEAHAPLDYSTDEQDDVAQMIASIRVIPFDERTPATEEDGA